MTATNEALILDLVEWVAKQPRLYSEAIDAWRTSCPRLTIWEDCLEQGLIARMAAPDRSIVIAATEAGRLLLSRHGRMV